VDWDNRTGVHVNEYFQTDNPDIYACGDCTSVYKFTHSADFQARMAVRNMFLGNTNKESDLLIPWCTYTEPEIAHVGKYEAELAAEGIPFESFTKQLADVDRCACDGVADGFVKLTIRSGTSQIVGATICGPNAGDMISEVTLAMQYGISLPQLAGTIVRFFFLISFSSSVKLILAPVYLLCVLSSCMRCCCPVYCAVLLSCMRCCAVLCIVLFCCRSNLSASISNYARGCKTCRIGI
jgi:hypothetical protein